MLVIQVSRERAPVSVKLTRVLTTVGSSTSADIRIDGIPQEWMVVERGDAHVRLTDVATRKEYTLELLAPLRVGHATFSLSQSEVAQKFPVEALSTALHHVDAVNDALRVFVSAMLVAADADDGAILLPEQGDYKVAICLDRAGKKLEAGADLISDTLVREALSRGTDMFIDDLMSVDAYRNIPSVTSLHLRSVACVPLHLEGRVVGLVYLGRRNASRPFSSEDVQNIRVAAHMTLPWLHQVRRAERSTHTPALANILGESAAVDEMRKRIVRIAPSELSVCIGGETGTGKELVARALHAESRRASGPFIAINCSAIPESLLASELFGAKKGAFTGAVSDRVGHIEAANKGTLFLDEIGEMPLSMQAALLRVLETREVIRVGDTVPRKIDFRVVVATHKSLDAAVAQKMFREDLLFRLREVDVLVPPLRARGDDAVLLAQTFLRTTTTEQGLAPLVLGGEALAAIRAYAWPGNVRELRSTVRRAAVLAEPPNVRASDLGLGAHHTKKEEASTTRRLDEARDEFIARYVNDALEAHAGDREAAARALGISVRSLYRYLSGAAKSGSDD